MATLEMPSRSSAGSSASTAASSSGFSTLPAASMRSGTVKRRKRGTSGFGLSMKMSYWS